MAFVDVLKSVPKAVTGAAKLMPIVGLTKSPVLVVSTRFPGEPTFVPSMTSTNALLSSENVSFPIVKDDVSD